MSPALFAQQDWLVPLAFGWLILAAALAWAVARGRRRLFAFLGEQARGRGLAPRLRSALADLGPLLALLAIAVALLGPRIGQGTIRLSTSGIDVAILLDLSQSMDAKDTPPSRLDAAQALATKLLLGLEGGDRAALAVFSGRGVLLTPLTPDRDALVEMIGSLDTTLVKPSGSNLADGIRSALTAFEPNGRRPRAVFVLSDGEMHGGDQLSLALDHLRDAVDSTRVFAAAIGTEAGTTIPDRGAPLRNSVGEIVQSRRHLSTLEGLAAATQGRVFTADAWGAIDLTEALRELRAPVASTPLEYVEQTVTVPVVLPFAALAIGLLVAEWLPGLRTRRRRARRVAAGAFAAAARPVALATLAVVLVAAASPDDDVSRSSAPPSVEALMARGFEAAEHGDWQRAERAFRAAAMRDSQPARAALGYHNVGVAAMENGEWERARDAFFESLAAGAWQRPGYRRQTQWNLEWTLARLADEQPPKVPENSPQPPDRQKPAPEPGAQEPEEPEQTEQKLQTELPPEPRTPEQSQRRAEAPPEPLRTRPHKAPPSLDAGERAQWLERVEDDPHKALLSVAFESPEDARRRPKGAPRW